MSIDRIGIVGYGGCVPKQRIKVEEIARVWNQDIQRIKSGLKIFEKSVPSCDQDTATLSVVAAQNALARANIDKQKIGALYIGSESHPYAVKPTSTIVASALGLHKSFMTADLEFACKAGTAALQIGYAMVKAGMVSYSITIGADTAQAAPGDILEYSASAAGAAFILGSNSHEIIATIDATLSITSDTPDFWRRNQQSYPEHTHRFTGEPSYFKHVVGAAQEIFAKTGLGPSDFDYVIFHQPNGKFPRAAAKKLGFSLEQLLPGLLVEKIGNSYSACSLIGLTSVLDSAQPHQKILLVSYGSGSGSDAFVLTTTKNITKKQKLAPTTQEYIDNKEYISYAKMRLRGSS